MINILKDRFTRGFLAGVGAGLLADTWNLLSYHILRMSELRFLDFIAIFTYGRETKNIWEAIFSEFTILAFYGLLGIIFVYLLLYIRSENLLFKGWFFGVITWFAVYAVTNLFQVPELNIIPFHTALSNFIGASIYGIALGLLVNYLDKKVRV